MNRIQRIPSRNQNGSGSMWCAGNRNRAGRRTTDFTDFTDGKAMSERWGQKNGIGLLRSDGGTGAFISDMGRMRPVAGTSVVISGPFSADRTGNMTIPRTGL
jgi:hypothetical protein